MNSLEFPTIAVLLAFQVGSISYMSGNELPPFQGSDLQTLGSTLQGSVYDLLALAAIAKQCHWNVTGPMFLPIHDHLDHVFASALSGVDELAERMNALGLAPSGQASDVASHSSLANVPAGFLRDHDVVALMTDRLGLCVRLIRSRMDAIESVDSVTADMMHTVVETLEKHLWKLRAQKY